MEKNKTEQIEQSNWDIIEFTEEELESIEAAFESAASSSSRKPVSDIENGRNTRRKLPDSLFNSSSSALSPCCPRNRFRRSNNYCQDMNKLRIPAMAFKGHIVYSRTLSEVEKAADELLTSVETMTKDGGRAAIGFDIEWKPSFKKGVKQAKASVLQLCVDAARCHVMHIVHSGFPENLKSLLGDPRCLKVGVGIAGDARKVFNDHNVSVDALEDLSRLANRKLGEQPKLWGLSSLTEKLICKQVLKPNNIRLGNWEKNPLSPEQLSYAATDAYVSWYLFEVLNRLPDPDTSKSEAVEAESNAPS